MTGYSMIAIFMTFKVLPMTVGSITAFSPASESVYDRMTGFFVFHQYIDHDRSKSMKYLGSLYICIMTYYVKNA